MKLSVTVDLNVIRNNLYRIRESTGREILLMVKADGYGHGMTEVAEATSDIVAMFGVATVEEGAELRAAGIEKVFSPPYARRPNSREPQNAGLRLPLPTTDCLTLLQSTQKRTHRPIFTSNSTRECTDLGSTAPVQRKSSQD